MGMWRGIPLLENRGMRIGEQQLFGPVWVDTACVAILAINFCQSLVFLFLGKSLEDEEGFMDFTQLAQNCPHAEAQNRYPQKVKWGGDTPAGDKLNEHVRKCQKDKDEEHVPNPRVEGIHKALTPSTAMNFVE